MDSDGAPTMTLRVDNCLARAGFSLGLGDQWPSEVSGLDVVNEVGEWLYGQHSWKFLEGREGYLNLRGSITFTGASSSTVTLTSTGSWADYTFLDGDKVQLTSGSGVTLGFYDVASRTDDDDIVLKTSPGTTGTSLAGTLSLPTIALPSDFQEMQAGHAINAESNQISIMVPVTSSEVGRLRSSLSSSGATWPYHYYISHNSLGVPIIEIYPAATTNSNNYFRILYRAKWTPLENDTDEIERLPAWLEGLFMLCVTEWTRGLLEEDSAPVDVRMGRIRASTLFHAATQQDGRIQRSYGHLRGGAVSQSRRRGGMGYLGTEVSAPS